MIKAGQFLGKGDNGVRAIKQAVPELKGE
jgi:hypothetical protein